VFKFCVQLATVQTLYLVSLFIVFFLIPTSRKSKDFKAPDGTVGETLQKNCQGLKVLLVDERSDWLY